MVKDRFGVVYMICLLFPHVVGASEPIAEERRRFRVQRMPRKRGDSRSLRKREGGAERKDPIATANNRMFKGTPSTTTNDSGG